MSIGSGALPGLGHSLDISSTQPTPFGRLVRVSGLVGGAGDAAAAASRSWRTISHGITA